MSIYKKIKTAWRILLHLGPRWVAFRLWYQIQRRLGLLEKISPLGAWPRVLPVEYPRIFTTPVNIGEGCLKEAADIKAGKFKLFSFHTLDIGSPPDWHLNQITGEYAKSDLHWSKLENFEFGDIKSIWELSRFSWAFALARAYAKTHDENHADLFWSLFENWMFSNPKNSGVNWMCGQEASFRLMAATFAVDVMGDARSSTPDRRLKFSAFVAATGNRIAANLDYALSQSNNHGISEAVGLVTAALLVPNYPEAKNWKAIGIMALEKQISSLVYMDGSFSQHSANYQRVLLHDLLWFKKIMGAYGELVPETITHAAMRAVWFVESLLTRSTGAVPMYGANDGANILQLADEKHFDFRSVVQAGYAVFFGRRLLEQGPWDELADWLVGQASEEKKPYVHQLEEPVKDSEKRVHHPYGGCLIWRNGKSRLFFRCPTVFRHRPSQADMLHVDMEWNGIPIAIDAGTYSYNANTTIPWDLKEASLHNTVTFNGKEPLERLGRFLFLPWPRGNSGWQGSNLFTAEHSGWSQIGCRHVRSIEAGNDDSFNINDSFYTNKESFVRVHWLLPDLPYTINQRESCLTLKASDSVFRFSWDFPGAEIEIVRAAPDSNRGWCAPFYFHRHPALSFSLQIKCFGKLKGSTRISPDVVCL